jgi:hypothetical protein
MKKRFYVLLPALLFLFTHQVHAQQLQLSEEARISLITILPGEAPEELFGHSAVRVYDPVNNIDISYNYGTFEFDEFFLFKFAYGDLEYFLSQATFNFSIHHYRDRRRPMIEQVLNLSPDQTQDLFNFLRENARVENRYYQYDFLYDNCSTRIRDALESVLGNNVEFANDELTDVTFRDMIHQYVSHRPFIHLGIDLLLGSNIDRNVTIREQMFLPDYLMHEFERATVIIDGERQPLVSSTETILEIQDYEIESRFPWAIFLTWSLLFIGIIVTYNTITKNRSVLPWFDVPLFLITGLIGLLIAFLWFFSLHTETVNNLNLFWAWPLHVLLISFLWRASVPRNIVSYYLALYTICCTVLLLGWFFWTQVLHPAIFPLLLLMMMRSGAIVYQSDLYSRISQRRQNKRTESKVVT